MNKDEKAGLWSERIQEFQSSGQTCRDWCTEHQIPVSTMTYWIRKQKKEKNVPEEEKEPVFAKLPSGSEIVMRDTPDELRQVTLKEMHWLCDGLSLEQKDAFKDHHPKVVV